MKTYIYCFSIFAAIGTGHIYGDTLTNNWGPVTNNIQMSICIESNKYEIKPNESVNLIIRFRNLSTNMSFAAHNSLQAQTDPETGVYCTVISPSGSDISPNTEKTYAGGSGAAGLVGPNKTYEFAFRLSDLCKFNKHGTYKITAKKVVRLQDGRKPIEVVSNTLRLSVVRVWP